MATINDYKIIANKSQKYLELLAKEIEFDISSLPSKQRERLGFYLFAIENLTHLSDVLDIAEIVSDTDFNSILFDDRYEDCGVDAVVIDEENPQIYLFNFKYRDKFVNKKQSINETILSTKFINAIINEDTSSLSGKTKINAENIVTKLRSNEIWKLSLYVVSNEDFSFNQKDIHLEQLEKAYGLETISIGLEEISQFVSLRPEPVNANLIVENDAIMSFTESSISSSKSYVIRLPLSELIRISCTDSGLRNQHNIEDISPLSSAKLDFSILFDNVRGLVIKSKYNKNISHTLKNDPTKFFMYNNGLTLTAKDISATPVNANKKVILDLESIQVLNGGQTLRTIHAFNSEDPKHLEDYLSNSEVLIRIFKTATDQELNNKIAEYTNSQNSISNVDLKSLRTEQLKIEQYLDDFNIIYARKSGDTGLKDDKSYDHKISMEKFGQILISYFGMPERATNQKKNIFDKYYDTLFTEENFRIEEYPKMIRNYFRVKKEFDTYKPPVAVSEQKIFYILFLETKLNMSTHGLISLLQETVSEYQPPSGKEVSEARKLIQLNFKALLDEKIEGILDSKKI